jgi:hypothetical protein
VVSERGLLVVLLAKKEGKEKGEFCAHQVFDKIPKRSQKVC